MRAVWDECPEKRASNMSLAVREAKVAAARGGTGLPTNPGRKLMPTLLAAGGTLAAFGAAACCVAPFALFMIGISGAWIGNLTALGPYAPILETVAAASIGSGFYLAYRKPKSDCDAESYCASPSSSRVTKIMLWVATLLFAVAVGFPKLARFFL